MKKTLLSIALMLVVSIAAIAQKRTITGTVTAKEDKQPLPGVSILVKGTSVGTQTDLNGKYTLSVPEEAHTLIYTYIGYTTKEVPLGKGNVINVELISDAQQLGEVVVTALGISRQKKSLGYAVTDIKGDDLKRSGEVNIIESLSAKSAGVQVTGSGGTPGASSKIVLRAPATITGDVQPLIVVDGVPIDNTTTQTTAGDYPFNQNLSGVNNSNRAIDLNPDDIESVTILKGPAAAALYGAKAGNGAIVYTTKRGKSRKGLGINLGQTFEIANVTQLPPRQSTYAQGTIQNGVPTYFTADPGPDHIYNTDDDISGGTSASWGPLISSVPGLSSHDNADVFFKTSTANTTNLSFDGGSDKVTYRFAIGNTYQNGVVPGTNFKRTSFRLTADGYLKDWLKVGGTANYIKSGGQRVQNGSTLGGVMLGLMRMPASFDINPYTFDNGFQRTYFSAGYDNPFYTAYENPFNDNVNRILGNIYISYLGKPWFNVTYKLGVDTYSDDRRQVFAISSWGNDAADQTGQVNYGSITNRDINSDLIFTGSGEITKDITLNYTAGHNVNSSNFGSLYSRGTVLSIPNFYDLSNAANLYSSTSKTRKYTWALFGQLDFGFRDMLFLTVSGRNEWSSTFGASKNNFFYPSASVSWLFNQTFKLPDWFTFGKFRYAYSQAGISPVPYQAATFFKVPIFTDGFTNGISFPYGGVSGFGYDVLSNLGSENLKPERVTGNELGLNLKFIKNRINLDLTWYNQETKDVLLFRPLASSTGFASVYGNSGKLRNRGFEVEANADIYKGTDFNWNLGITWARNRSEVLKLADGVDQFEVETGFGDPGAYAIVGQPLGVLYGSKWARDDKGNLLIDDSGLPFQADQFGPLGNPWPDWTGGIRNTFSYKGVSLNVLFDIRHGGSIWNGTQARLNRLGRSEASADRERTYIVPGVKSDGTPNDIPISAFAYYNFYLGDNGSAVEQNIVDVNWFRVREITLGYTFHPKAWEKYVQSIGFNVTGRNLFLSTNYNGVDPETSLTGAGSNIQGFDYFNNPGARSFIFGINLGF
ncbi:SusC/RagA family TonB-linked outer membrane protein [Solitalea koreensis]|uniref:TonB-linked outer membrane protein, SusC/RagA family n=1 Tax=Solitalea koreensis TaxID=543615 RepID=A0A521C9U5_9SPHI|nr:SusC/RagA family TonB-linked outer membrane protein [Solitalea koreensis]SMO56247.1 TonB-linked outer membrane protein, SusC/RagA family [Solitalea koreensis]